MKLILIFDGEQLTLESSGPKTDDLLIFAASELTKQLQPQDWLLGLPKQDLAGGMP